MKSQGRPVVQLASLDTFHFPSLQRGLSREFLTNYLTTWSLKRKAPNSNLKCHNAVPLHYLLQLYKMFPWTQWDNRTYFALCCAFDLWFKASMDPGADVMCYLSGTGLSTGRAFRRQTGRPVVVDSGSTHTDFQHQIVLEEFKRNGISSPLFPDCYRNRVRTEFSEADWIQVPTEFVAQTYVRHGIPRKKILLAAYGADTSRFTTRMPEDMEPTFRAICPSGVNLRKGARVLAQAWRKLGWKDAELHWIGARTPATAHLFEPSISGIVWHGHMNHEMLAALYRTCDVIVLPSFEEGFARVLIEAAASGVAPIATPNSGVEELFSEGYPEGWLIPCNDIDALCECLSEARSDRQKTFEKGQAAARKVLDGFTWDDYGTRVCTNFHRILDW